MAPSLLESAFSALDPRNTQPGAETATLAGMIVGYVAVRVALLLASRRWPGLLVPLDAWERYGDALVDELQGFLARFPKLDKTADSVLIARGFARTIARLPSVLDAAASALVLGLLFAVVHSALSRMMYTLHQRYHALHAALPGYMLLCGAVSVAAVAGLLALGWLAYYVAHWALSSNVPIALRPLGLAEFVGAAFGVLVDPEDGSIRRRVVASVAVALAAGALAAAYYSTFFVTVDASGGPNQTGAAPSHLQRAAHFQRAFVPGALLLLYLYWVLGDVKE